MVTTASTPVLSTKVVAIITTIHIHIHQNVAINNTIIIYVVWRKSVGVYHRCEVKQRRVNQVVSSMGVQHGCTVL